MKTLTANIFLLFCAIAISFAQNKTTEVLAPVDIIEGDTVIHVMIDEIPIFPPKVFKNRYQKWRYTRLVRYVKKVYPYSQLVKQKLLEIDNALDTIPEEERRKFVKRKERELRAEFEDEVTGLTIMQGKILMKLIDRETGMTTFNILDEYKSDFSAVFWQSIARIFGHDLKKEYDPLHEDQNIEEIVLMIEYGII